MSAPLPVHISLGLELYDSPRLPCLTVLCPVRTYLWDLTCLPRFSCLAGVPIDMLCFLFLFSCFRGAQNGQKMNLWAGIVLL